MLWDNPQPLHSRILHRHIGIEPTRDCVRNSGLTLFREQFEEFFLLGNQGVNLAGFVVKERSDGFLLIDGWKWCSLFKITSLVKILDSRCLIY
ncbi:hypothetical protein C6Q14_34850 [Burkholderia ambifaria]|nr:hypothetical protein C6Q14_34850 [Burkholderia ambifaria]